MRIKNGKQICGFSLITLLVRMIGNNSVRSLPLSTLLAINNLFKEGKVTKVNEKYFFNSFMPPFPGEAFDRLIKNIHLLKIGIGVPISTFIAVTNQCYYDCWHCSYHSRVNDKILNIEELKNLINELQKLGCTMIGLTGGEPLLREDIAEIISLIDHRSASELFTTGYNLTFQKAKELKKAGLTYPVISLDHYKKQIHDKLRRYDGAYEIALEAIKIFRELGFYVVVTFAPTRDMVRDNKALNTYFDFVNSIGVDEVRVASPSLSGKLLGKEEERFSEEEMEHLCLIQGYYNKKRNYTKISSFPLYESKRQFGCGAGFHHCFVDHAGNVCPCDVSPLSFGNIRKKTFSEIYQLLQKYFYLPGVTCYSYTTKEQVMDKFQGTLPLSEIDSISIVNTFPPRPDTDLPLFYKKIGLKNLPKRERL